jgi:hypothetical protein
MCVEELGVDIINDISGGGLDKAMFPTVAKLGVPYILMHMKGTPQTMQEAPHYDDLLKEVMLYFAERIQRLRDLGQKDIILDPGYGFAKTLEHNYELLQHQEMLHVFELPLLVGVSLGWHRLHRGIAIHRKRYVESRAGCGGLFVPMEHPRIVPAEEACGERMVPYESQAER